MSAERGGRRLQRYALLAVLLLAWGLRLWNLAASDLTFDEAATYYVVNRPLLAVLPYLQGAVREHPPVYYLLVRTWIAWVGTGEFALRAFSVLASLLEVALLARLVRLLERVDRVDRVDRVGRGLPLSPVLPALIMALLPLDVWYARDARMYTLTGVWALLSALVFVRHFLSPARDVRPSVGAVGLLLLVNLLALLTHYVLALLVLAQFVLLLALRRWRALAAWTAGHGLLALAGVGWLLTARGLAATLAEMLGRYRLRWPAEGAVEGLLTAFLFGPVPGFPRPIVWGALACAALGLLLAWRRNVGQGAWLSLSLLLPLLLAFCLPEPPQVRYLTYLLPFWALALGCLQTLPHLLAGWLCFRAGAHGRPRGWRRLAGGVVPTGSAALLLAAGYFFGVAGLPRTLRAVKSTYGHTITYVRDHFRPGDAIVFHGPWQELQFFYYDPGDLPPITRIPPFAPPQVTPEAAEPVLADLAARHARLWVLPASVEQVDPNGVVSGWLNHNTYPARVTRELGLYLAAGGTMSVTTPALQFGDAMRLERVAHDPLPIAAGEALRLDLDWAALRALPAGVEVSLALVDPSGWVWAQSEAVPGEDFDPPEGWSPGHTLTERRALLMPDGLPPGTYTLRLAVVDRDGGTALQPADAAGARSEPYADLLAVRVGGQVTSPVLAGLPGAEVAAAFDSPTAADGRLRLAGSEPGGRLFQQGQSLPWLLHWQAEGHLPDLQVQLALRHTSLLGLRDAEVLSQTLPLVAGYPSSAWAAGRLVSQPLGLVLPPDTPPGRAELLLRVIGPGGNSWPAGDVSWVRIGDVHIERRPVERRLPSGLTRVEVDFGEDLALRGYRIEGEARPGGQVRVTYAWYTRRRPGAIYAVFNHLLASDGTQASQADSWLQAGAALSTQWQPGEYVQTTHLFEIPATAPAGPYRLAVGVYDAATGARVAAVQEGQRLPDDRLLLDVRR